MVVLFTIVTFIFFTALVAVISYVKTKGDDQTTTEGYFLAGRGLPGVIIAGSLLLTNLSAEQLVGTNGQTWGIGMSPMAFEVLAAAALIVMAMFATPRYLKSGIATIPELLGQRYDRSTKLLFSIAYIAIFLIVQLPVILYSGSLVFENIFNLSGVLGISKFQSVIILCISISIVGSIYAIVGGLKAVAVSDTINGIGLLIGGFMIPFLALNTLGHVGAGAEGIAIVEGMKYLIQEFPEKLNSIAPADALPPAVPWPTIFTGMMFMSLHSWCCYQSFIQRVLAAKDLKEAQKGTLYCAFLKIIGFMYLALPGVIAFALFEKQGTQVSMMDDAYPQLVTQVIPAPLMGFFAAVMFGAILSSFNSVLNSVSTMFSMDIYKDFINPEASETKLVSVGKRMGILFAVATTVVGPLVYFFPAGLKTFLDSLLLIVGIPVLTAVFGGFFFKYLPPYAAKVILIFHIIFYGGFLIFISGTIHYMYAIAVLWPIEMLAMYLMSYYNRRRANVKPWEQVDVEAVDMTPWKYRWVVSAFIMLCVIAVYVVFSPLGIGV